MASHAERMGKMLEEGLFTDCTIIAADGVKFQAHKGVLACQSSVFRAMFEHEMIEAKEGIVRIKQRLDIKSPVLEQMLFFIYTGTAPKLGDKPIQLQMQLFEAADEYLLGELKALCEQSLVRSIKTNKDIIDLLAWCDERGDKKLKAAVIEYIRHSVRIGDELRYIQTKG